MELCFITGEMGSGKSYFCVKRLVEEVLPNYDEFKVLTNLPLFLNPEWEDRVTVETFERGWVPPGDSIDDQLEGLRDTIVIVDEYAQLSTRESGQNHLELISLARKRNTQWILISQSKDDFPKALDDRAGLWIECYKSSEMRDPVFGFRLYDLANLRAKITGKYVETMLKTEYLKRNRRWRACTRVPYRERMRQEIADQYDTKSGVDHDEQGNAVVVHDYQRFGFWRLLSIVARRNAHVVPYFVLRMSFVFGPFVVGGAWLWWLAATPAAPAKVVTPAERVRIQTAEAPRVDPPRPVAARRVVTWCVMALACLLAGCRTVSPWSVPESPAVPHVGRPTADSREPRAAVFGAGHSLDSVLADAGYKSQTGLSVDGPLIGRELLDAARHAGYGVRGDTLVPARKRAVPVPQELGAVDGAVSVGGLPVKVVSEDELVQWQELSGVVHEAYQTELLIVACQSSRSRDLAAVASGQGVVTVSQPPAAVPWSGQARVSLSANGSQLQGREVARPILTSAPGASADVHVGNRIPVRLSQSTVAQATTTVSDVVQYVTTGTQVGVRVSRVSASQVRLSGTVSVSQQTATVEGIPATAERTLSIDHLVQLGEWVCVGRLDAASDRSSSGWLALGGLRSSADETFLVLSRVSQVHSQPVAARDERAASVQVEGESGGHAVAAPPVQVAPAAVPSVTPAAGPATSPGPLSPGQLERISRQPDRRGPIGPKASGVGVAK